MIHNCDGINYLLNLPPRSVDHIITDPPYSETVHKMGMRTGAKYAGGEPSIRTDLGFDHLTDDNLAMLMVAAQHACKGWLIAFCDLESLARYRDAANDAGLKFKRAGVWVKLNCAPQFTGTHPAQGAEGVAIIWCGTGKPSWNGGGLPAVWSYPIVISRGDGADRIHPCQKPLALMSRLVELFTRPGQIVIDPFVGSGTTLIACKRLGRVGVGCEVNPETYRIAADRLLLAPAGDGAGEAQMMMFGRGRDE